MSKFTKQYLVEIVDEGKYSSKRYEQPVKDRNLKNISLNDKTVCFYFYSQDFTTINAKTYLSEKYDVSDTIYVGKRITKLQALEMFKYRLNYKSFSRIKASKSDTFCITPNGGLFALSNGDVTIEEYMKYEQENQKAR